MEITKLAWAAGFFDGEGCIMPNYKRRGKTLLRVTVGQTVLEPLEVLKQEFGGWLEIDARKPPNQTYYRWVICGPSANRFLNSIQPFLRVKNKHTFYNNTSKPS